MGECEILSYPKAQYKKDVDDRDDGHAWASRNVKNQQERVKMAMDLCRLEKKNWCSG